MPRSLPLRAALALLAAWLPLPSLTAATHTVLPDTSIQAKIDLAQPGDVVAILGGAYDQDLTITKAIRLVEADGQDVTITGNITFSGVTNAPPFEGFAIGAPGKFLTVTNTTALTLKNIDGSTGGGLKASGNSKLAVAHCRFASVQQDGGQLTLTDSQITTDFLTTASSEKTVVLRVAIGRLAEWALKKFTGSDTSFVVIASTITCLDVPYPTVNCSLSGSGNNFRCNQYWYTKRGGVVPSNMLIGDPKLVADQAPKHQSTSTCVHASVADPNFNDIDGWTTDKPVLIALDLGHLKPLQCADSENIPILRLAVGASGGWQLLQRLRVTPN